MNQLGNLPQMDFSREELRAILAILKADIERSRTSANSLPKQQRAKEQKRILLIDCISKTLEQQIQTNEVRFMLTLEELKAVIQSLKVYRNYVSTMFESSANRNRALTISRTWLERFESHLLLIQSPVYYG